MPESYFRDLNQRDGSSEIVTAMGDSRGYKLSALTRSVYAIEIHDGHT